MSTFVNLISKASARLGGRATGWLLPAGAVCLAGGGALLGASLGWASDAPEGAVAFQLAPRVLAGYGVQAPVHVLPAPSNPPPSLWNAFEVLGVQMHRSEAPTATPTSAPVARLDDEPAPAGSPAATVEGESGSAAPARVATRSNGVPVAPAVEAAAESLATPTTFAAAARSPAAEPARDLVEPTHTATAAPIQPSGTTPTARPTITQPTATATAAPAIGTAALPTIAPATPATTATPEIAIVIPRSMPPTEAVPTATPAVPTATEVVAPIATAAAPEATTVPTAKPGKGGGKPTATATPEQSTESVPTAVTQPVATTQPTATHPAAAPTATAVPATASRSPATPSATRVPPTATATSVPPTPTRITGARAKGKSKDKS